MPVQPTCTGFSLAHIFHRHRVYFTLESNLTEGSTVQQDAMSGVLITRHDSFSRRSPHAETVRILPSNHTISLCCNQRAPHVENSSSLACYLGGPENQSIKSIIRFPRKISINSMRSFRAVSSSTSKASVMDAHSASRRY